MAARLLYRAPLKPHSARITSYSSSSSSSPYSSSSSSSSLPLQQLCSSSSLTFSLQPPLLARPHCQIPLLFCLKNSSSSRPSQSICNGRSFSMAARAEEGLKDYDQPLKRAQFASKDMEKHAGPVPSPYGSQPPPNYLQDIHPPSTYNKNFHAVEADLDSMPPPASSIAELLQQLKEKEGKALPTPITLPPVSISKPDTFEEWLYQKELYEMEVKLWRENLPVEMKVRKLRSGKTVGPKLKARKVAWLRKRALLHGLIWPWEKPVRPRRPTIFRGRLHQIKHLERQEEIKQKMEAMPKLLEAYRAKRAEIRTRKRFEKMDAVDRVVKEPPK